MKLYTSILLVLVVLSLVFSCKHNSKRLEGTWIGAYSFSSKEGVEKSLKIPVRNLIVFSETNIYQNGFKIDSYTEKSLNYNKRTKTLRSYEGEFGKFSDVIQQITSDSLVIATIDESGNVIGNMEVYRRLSDSLKKKENCEIQLTSKKFVIESEVYKDTIFFKNDTLLTKSSNKTKNTFLRWERVQINDFDVIFIDNDVPYLINCNKDGSIKATAFYDKKYNFRLYEIIR